MKMSLTNLLEVRLTQQNPLKKEEGICRHTAEYHVQETSPDLNIENPTNKPKPVS